MSTEHCSTLLKGECLWTCNVGSTRERTSVSVSCLRRRKKVAVKIILLRMERDHKERGRRSRGRERRGGRRGATEETIEEMKYVKTETIYYLNWSQRHWGGMPQLTLLMCSFPPPWQNSAGHSLPLLGVMFSIYGIFCPRGGNIAQPSAMD